MGTAHARLRALLQDLGLGLDADAATFTGADPVLPCRYPVGESAAAVMAAIGLAADRLAGGAPRTVSVDVRHAAAHLRGFLDQRIDGEVLDADPTGRLPLVGLYRASDGGWVQTYGLFPSLRAPTLAVLGLPDDADPDRAAMAAAVARYPGHAADLAEALNAAGAPAALVLSREAWDAHPQGRALHALPPVLVERIGDAPPSPPRGGLDGRSRPLAGLRVLDLTRILAGPACGRTLAEHGADVLALSAPRLPTVRRAWIDTAVGKRAAALDFASSDDRPRLDALLADADVFLQNARPGAFARRGLGAEAVAERRPGIVYVSIDTYGQGGGEGPWAGRPGFEPLAQASTGWALEHAIDDEPKIVPALPCDYATGYLAALGVLDALARRATEGGSWHVRASLCRTAMWLRDQPGRVDPAGAIPLGAADTLALRRAMTGPFGVVDHLMPAVRIAGSEPGWTVPAPRPDGPDATFAS